MSKPILHFCTAFDHHYAAIGLALYRSLKRHAPPFVLWVLALDREMADILARLGLGDVRVIPLADLERAEPTLLKVKTERSTLEYYYTLEPCLPSYLFATEPQIDRLTRLDPDLWFFADLEPLLDELGPHSVHMTPQRLTLRRPDVEERFGRFNAGWISFRRTADGLACLEEWKRQCLDWCYHRMEDGKHGSERYLDAWPAKYDCSISRHIGANVGYWNSYGRTISLANDSLLIDGEPLIFFHYSSLRRHTASFYSTHRHFPRPVPLLRDRVYRPYIAALRQAEKDIARVRADQGPSANAPWRARALGGVRCALSVLRAFANRRLIAAA